MKKLYEKIKKLKPYITNSFIYFFYYKRKINSKLVYIESKGGSDLAGNMLRIAEELSKPLYGKLKFVFYAKKDVLNKFRQVLSKYGVTNYILVSSSYKAVCYMELAKYIFTDANLRPEYVKKEGQIVLNTWHGTPLKLMGRKNCTEKIEVGTQQRINFNCDYLLYPNRYMAEIMLKDYMIENLTPAKILWEGYPRNAVFFDGIRRQKVKDEIGLSEKKIYAYMPTYRGIWWSADKSHSKEIERNLHELDSLMSDDEVLLVKLHLYTKKSINMKGFKHIAEFPEGFETYDVLNTADCLITDYSSVFFDFANTKKKIILFSYDEEKYFENRGVYIQLSELPFPNVKTAKDLYSELVSPKNYDDTEFIAKFCTYDNAKATENICRHIVLREKICSEDSLSNGKENVLIFGGALGMNGITTALVNLLRFIDKERNYYVAIRKADICKTPERINVIPDESNYLIMDFPPCRTLKEMYASKKFSSNRSISLELPKSLKRLYEREWVKNYGAVSFSHLIQFDGYGIDINLMYLLQSVPKTIFVHNDMQREIAGKSWQHPATLRLCYSGYDSVAVVSEDLIKPTSIVSGKLNNIVTVNNYHNYKSIVERSTESIEFQKNTSIQNFSIYGIEEILNSNCLKFVSIGRFSSEKNHIMLIEAFNKFWLENQSSYLIIVGGYGAMYEKTIEKARAMRSWKNIIIIRSMSNPMPILKKCDLFILPSVYEGLPITVKEADTLGIPVLTAVIPSMQSFAKKYNLYQVPRSVDGIYRGMKDFSYGRIVPMNIDYEEYNREALEQFNSLFL